MLKLALKAIVSKSIGKSLFGKQITEEQIKPILKEIRIALLNSDVNLKVIKFFIEEIKESILNEKQLFKNQTEIEVFVLKTIKEKLIKILGFGNQELNIQEKGLTKILFVGMNGTGKTTTTGKMSYFLKHKKNLKVKNISLDIYRPGAFNQLETISKEIGVDFFHVENNDIIKTISENIKNSYDDNTNALIFDTAGIIPDKSDQLEELKKIHASIQPHETIFVIDAMSGQDLIEKVEFFNQYLNITALIISKADSNAPMGAAFSANYLLKIPIKFLGEGEKPSDLTQFHPDRIAGKILGEGDIVGLAEKIEEVIDKKTAKNSFERMMTGKFDLNDLMSQIKEMKKFGSMKMLMGFLPKHMAPNVNTDGIDEEMKIWEIIINSMTDQEKKQPKLFKKQPNRKIRVIKGSGRKPDELNKLLKRWETGKQKVEEMTKKLGKGFNLSNLFG